MESIEQHDDMNQFTITPTAEQTGCLSYELENLLAEATKDPKVSNLSQFWVKVNFSYGGFQSPPDLKLSQVYTEQPPTPSEWEWAHIYKIEKLTQHTNATNIHN